MFYGWKIVGVTFLTHFISIGFVFYSYGVFFSALATEFGGQRLKVAVGISVMHCATGIFSPAHLLCEPKIFKIPTSTTHPA